MAISSSQSNTVYLEASNVYWGRGNCKQVTLVDDVAGSLTDEYFELNAIDESGNEKQFYVLFSGTTPAIDPAPVGKVKIEVVYVDGDSKEAIAALYKTALEATGYFFSKDSGAGVVISESHYMGPVSVEDDSNAPSFTFEVLQAGFGGSLGATKEGIDFSMETSTFEIKLNQKADYLNDEIFTGAAASMSMALAEMTTERWETIVGGVIGDIVEPSGGTKVVGMGESKLFQSMSSLGGRLLLHPIRLLDSDKSADVLFWKSAPLPQSVNFDGTDSLAMECEFKAYLAKDKNEKINLWTRGDWTQEGLDA
jgi:hypothetical protein